jgi:hypothetical protein
MASLSRVSSLIFEATTPGDYLQRLTASGPGRACKSAEQPFFASVTLYVVTAIPS